MWHYLCSPLRPAEGPRVGYFLFGFLPLPPASALSIPLMASRKIGVQKLDPVEGISGDYPRQE